MPSTRRRREPRVERIDVKTSAHRGLKLGINVDDGNIGATPAPCAGAPPHCPTYLRTAARRRHYHASRMARILVALVVIACGAPAHADDAAQLYARGNTEYALGHFEAAARLFEQSFEQSHEPVLIFDAAQAYRLGGQPAPALTRYKSYLRLGGVGPPHRAAVVALTERLQTQLVTAPAPSIATVAAAPLPRPLVRRPWFWVGVGGAAVVVGLAVGLGVGFGAERAPNPTIGGLSLN